jgi:hypothetical protein
VVWFVRVCGICKGITIEVTPADRTRLQSIIRDRNSPQKHVWRSRIVLLTADGAVAIMRTFGKGKTVIWCWQEGRSVAKPCPHGWPS